MTAADDAPQALLLRARTEEEARGRLLEMYRNYLRLQAEAALGTALQVRVDPSDLVQETFLDALRDFGSFAGGTEAELLAWLRRILARNLADQARRHKARGRDVRRQESLEAMLEQSSEAVDRALATGLSTPSAAASRREQSVVLADALARLRPDDREVIVLRHVHGLKFDEIAARMARSPGAVRVLWTRALERLHRLLEAEP